MNVFLKPFVNNMQKIVEKGGVSWVHPNTQEHMLSMVAAPFISANAPAKAMVLNQKKF